MAYHPQFELLETHLPALFELPHPVPILPAIGDVHDDPDKIVPVGYSSMTPVTLDLLCLVAGGTEVVDNLKNCIGYPLSWNVAPVIEP